MKTKVCEEVRREILRVFGEDAGPIMTMELESVDIPLVSGSPDRVHMAVVFGAAGDVHRFREMVELSARDWRDTLVSAGLDGEDWREVLRRGGHWAPVD